MVKRVSAKNFKAFGNSPGLEVSLSGLNLFLGQNNSGKTSAADVLGVFVQTARDPSISGLRWAGSLVDLGSDGEHAFHKGRKNEVLSLSVEFSLPPDYDDLLKQEVETFGYRIQVKPFTVEYTYELLLNGHVFVRNLMRRVQSGGGQPALEFRENRIPNLIVVPSASLGSGIFNQALFLAQNLNANDDPQKQLLESLAVARDKLNTICEILSSKVFLLGSDRGIRKGALDQTFKLPDVGRDGQHTLQVLSAILTKPEYQAAAERIRYWAKIFGLPQVSSGWAGGPELYSGYTDPVTSTPLPLRSSGFGSQQVLPIIVQLFASPPGSLVVIEEPEISLHPAAQVDLVRMFAEVVTSGRQVLITTHSQYLMMALQELMGDKLSPSAVGVFHFSRDSNGSSAAQLPLNSDGIVSGWIPSFAQVDRELMSNWMSRVHEKLRTE